mgnify:FL=1
MLDVRGKIKYIHAVNFNKYGDWSITIYPDNESLEVIRDYQAKGWKNVMKKDDTGYFIQFKRAPQKLMRGKMVAFAAPKVYIQNGDVVEPMDGTKVGWGSDGIVRLEVYQHGTPSGGKSFANRWDSLKVTNLVPFEPDRSDWDADEINNAKSLAKVEWPD